MADVFVRFWISTMNDTMLSVTTRSFMLDAVTHSAADRIETIRERIGCLRSDAQNMLNVLCAPPRPCATSATAGFAGLVAHSGNAPYCLLGNSRCRA